MYEVVAFVNPHTGKSEIPLRFLVQTYVKKIAIDEVRDRLKVMAESGLKLKSDGQIIAYPVDFFQLNGVALLK